MATITIRFAESVVSDLEATERWYTEQGVPEVGGQLVTEIFGRIEALPDHPELGRMVPEFDQAFLRELVQLGGCPRTAIVARARLAEPGFVQK